MSDTLGWAVIVFLGYTAGLVHGYLIKGWLDRLDKDVLKFSWECLKRDILGVAKK
jgi:hypothetical protein